MKLIAVISHKGGAGKTTSAVQIAEELARRGQRTLLVDADRQQGAGLLLGIDAPAGCVQRTTLPNLDYLGSARLTDLEIADCYAGVENRFDIGVVDTPSLDDPLARGWLREATAVLMVLQVDPLTVKTLPSALNTLEVVRAFKPSIQLLGLLPTMFHQAEDTHGKLLAELLSRRPEAVFTPVVPADPGLMHRANAEDCPPVGEAARQAYECAVDRILRSLAMSTPSVSLPHAGARPSWSAQAGAPGAPGNPVPPVASPPRPWQETPAAAVMASPSHRPVGTDSPPAQTVLPPDPPAPQPEPWSMGTTAAAASVPTSAERALEELATPSVRPSTSPQGRRRRSGEGDMPEWWPGQEARIDAGGVARRPESWLVRSRFAIACTIACLALIAAVVVGTIRRVPSGDNSTPWNSSMRTAAAGTRSGGNTSSGDPGHAHKKSSVDKHIHGSGEISRSAKRKGNK